MSSIVTFRRVSKRYQDSAGRSRNALQDVSADIPTGRVVAVTGRSGSGKSTLLNLIAGIDVPSEGSIHVLGRDLQRVAEGERTRLRRDAIGLVFQFFHLLPHLSVRENVWLPALIAGDPASAFADRTAELLERVGLSDRGDDPVGRLSGGEMQRVAICRAILRRPRLLLADEPTGNLDDETSRVVMDQMVELVAEEGSTLVYVTHSDELAARADLRWQLHSGVLET